MKHTRRLVTIAHSYCVALNRRLAHEMARAGRDRWEVTAVAPDFFQGDLRPVRLEDFPGEASALKSVPAHFSNRIHFMLYGRRLRSILRESWDVVHCWEEPFVFAGGQVALWMPERARLVFATFQNIEKRYPPPFNWIEKYAMRRAAGWIAFGHTVEQTLAQRAPYGLRARRTIPPGVDLEEFYPSSDARRKTRESLGWKVDGAPVVGFLGRFVPQKGLELFTRVLDRIETPWRALVVGSGPMESSLRRWAARYGDRVRVVTGVRHEQVPAYLNSMDVLCAPSQTTPVWREQLGRMLIEAFACGVPVIASDSGEIPFVLGNAGIIINEKDEDAWVKALAELLDNRERRAELSRRGAERARTHFSWPIVAQRHLDFFEELLDGRGGDK